MSREQEEAGGDAEGRAQPSSGKAGMKGLEKHKVNGCEAGCGERETHLLRQETGEGKCCG